MSNIIEKCEGAKNSQDDIIIWGKSEEQLNERTSHVFEEIRKSGLIEMFICKNRINFFGS